MLTRTIIILSLIAVSAFLILKFFSRLTDINMFSAMGWAFRARVGFPIGCIVFYITAFMLFYVFFFLFPSRVLDMDTYHAGGLSGYRDAGDRIMVYDPSQGRYVSYVQYFVPLPEDKFTETFRVVSLFKSPSDDYYQDTESMGLANNLIASFCGMLMLAVACIFLYVIASEYIERHNLPDTLSYNLIAARFASITGLSPVKALIIFLSVQALFFGFNVISVKKIMHHYHGLYETHQQTLRSELMQKVSPGNTLTGVVTRRFQERKSEHVSDYEDKRDRGKTTYYTVLYYTVEFNNLIRIPVYLNLELNDGREEVKELDGQFTDRKAIVPNTMKEYAFIVNPDYSISLKR